MPDRDELRCPCGSGAAYPSCCGRVHEGSTTAVTAEQVMRARYSAFALGHEAYLLRSWASATRPAQLRLVPGQRWTGLEVVATAGGGPFDAEGVVEFRASYERRGVAGTLHERSTFSREGGDWVYVAALG